MTGAFPSSFFAELDKAGISWSGGGAPITDGKIHRFKGGGDKEDNSWYVLYDHGEGFVVGKFGCWKRGFTLSFTSREKSNFTKEQWGQFSNRVKEAERARLQEEQEAQGRVREKCRKLFSTALTLSEHPYLLSKNFPLLPTGCNRVYLSNDESYDEWLAIPLQDTEGVIHSVQFIAGDGTKKFQWSGRVQGCYYDVFERVTGPIILCEGYATGLSLYAATGFSVKCAMNAGNLMPVARALREFFPSRQLILAADNDQFTEKGNRGLTDARAVVAAIPNCVLTYPEFSESDFIQEPTDFNDLHRIEGLDRVEMRVRSSMPIVARPVGELQMPPDNDPTELLKYRFLCQRGGLLISGPTGMGKSSFIMQAYAMWANALAFFGIIPVRRMRCLLIQAENDDGDLAAMRDGICTGLGFTQEQRQIFFQNVLVHTSTGITGKAFFTEVVARLLDLHSPLDFCGIDPALSFIGGDVKEQKVVGEFLRTYLNPLLYAYNCSSPMLHHTNKPPSGKEKPSWSNGELAYLGSGSAEWANWARAILSLQSTGVPGLYFLNAAKRGSKLGWRDDEGATLYQKLIAWNREANIVCWRDADPDDIAKLEELSPTRAGGSGRKRSWTDEDFINLLGSGTGLSSDEWRVQSEKELGIKRTAYFDNRTRILNAGLVFQSPITKLWRKNPQEVRDRSNPND